MADQERAGLPWTRLWRFGRVMTTGGYSLLDGPEKPPWYEVGDDDARVIGNLYPLSVGRDVRSWVHETPLSRDHWSTDECEDWPVVDEVIGVVVRALEANGYEIVRKARG